MISCEPLYYYYVVKKVIIFSSLSSRTITRDFMQSNNMRFTTFEMHFIHFHKDKKEQTNKCPTVAENVIIIIFSRSMNFLRTWKFCSLTTVSIRH